jgi:hypothetical protein
MKELRCKSQNYGLACHRTNSCAATRKYGAAENNVRYLIK